MRAQPCIVAVRRGGVGRTGFSRVAIRQILVKMFAGSIGKAQLLEVEIAGLHRKQLETKQLKTISWRDSGEIEG